MKINSLNQQQMINSVSKERKNLPEELMTDKVVLGGSTPDNTLVMGDKIKELKSTAGDMGSAMNSLSSAIKGAIGLALGVTLGACGGGILANCM